MADDECFYDAVPSFTEENTLLEMLDQDSKLLTDALDSILESDWPNGEEFPLLGDINGDFLLTDFVVGNVDEMDSTLGTEDTSSNLSTTSTGSNISRDHDHTYAQRPPIVSKTLVFKDGRAFVKTSSEKSGEMPIGNGGQFELTRVTVDEAPLVIQHDDGGYNSMSETNSPRSTTTTGGSSMDTVLEDGDSFLSSLEKNTTRNELDLSHEEKEVLRSQGLPIPTCLPLTSVEKKALQMVRRRLKAKVSAKENRKKRKEYVVQLEEEVRRCNVRNSRLQRKVESLSEENKSLTTQLQTLQTLLAKCTQGATKFQQSVNVGTCLSVVVLCFALLLANFNPVASLTSQGQSSDHYSAGTVKTRALLSIEYPPLNSWLPLDWPSKGKEQCSNLLSVFLTLRFPKPYSLFDMYIDPMETSDIFKQD